MREIRSPGSVRGAARKGRPYRDHQSYERTSQVQRLVIARQLTR